VNPDERRVTHANNSGDQWARTAPCSIFETGSDAIIVTIPGYEPPDSYLQRR
jgi:hypothetical protein